MKKYQPNPLNTFELRQLNHCPPHFFAVDFDLVCNQKKVNDWIYEHLSGRFFLGEYYSIVLDHQNRRSILQVRAAFEVHSEASYFAMFLPEINKF